MVRPEAYGTVLVVGHVAEDVRHRLRRRLVWAGGKVSRDVPDMSEAEAPPGIQVFRQNLAVFREYRGAPERCAPVRTRRRDNKEPGRIKPASKKFIDSP